MKPNRNHFFKLSALVVCTLSLQAQTTTTLNWTGAAGSTNGSGNLLNTAANWQQNTVPSATTDLLIATRDGEGAIPTLIANGSYSVRSISVDNSAGRFNTTFGLRIVTSDFDESILNRTITFNEANIPIWTATNNAILRFQRNIWVANTTAVLNLDLDYTGFGIINVDSSSLIRVVTATLRGTGGIEKTGEGVLSIEHPGSYTGGVRILEGVLSVDAANGLGAAPSEFVSNHVSIDGGTLRLNSSSFSSESNRGFQLGAAGGTIEVNGNSSASISGAISGTGQLTKIGTGVLSIETVGSYSGGVRILQGVLSVNAPGGLGALPGSIVANQVVIDGGTLRFSDATTASGTNRGFQIGSNGGTIEVFTSTANISGPISGTGLLTKSGSSPLGLNGVNTYSGGTVIAQGRAAFNNSSSFGSGLITMENGTGIYANTADRDISNDFLLKGNSRFGNLATTLQSYNGSIDLNGATRDIRISSQVTWGGTVSNGGLFIDVDPDAKLTLSGSNTHTGPTTINSGVVALGAVGSFDSSPLITVNGILDTSAKPSFTILGSQTLAGNGTVIVGTGNELNVASGGTLAAGSSPGGLIFSGGTTTLDAGSIFSWELNDNVDSSTGFPGEGGNYDGLTTTDSGNLVVSPGAIFQVVLTAAVDRGNEFWNITRSWDDIFNIAGSTTFADLANGQLFETVQVMDGTSGSLFTPSNGSFSFTGSTLTWSAVPEPTTALAGMLLGAGLLRRRRIA